jgi:SAM-dependent methyltransferase
MWTERLLIHAQGVTAVDASPEMIELASARVGGDSRVRFVEADLFAWRPDRRYDVVFFGFWLSHVPPERFDSFWSLVADCPGPGGRVFFVDDTYRTSDELVEGESSPTVPRKLKDGTAFRAVKVQYTPAELERRLTELGWAIEVHATSGPFYRGFGHPALVLAPPRHSGRLEPNRGQASCGRPPGARAGSSAFRRDR